MPATRSTRPSATNTLRRASRAATNSSGALLAELRVLDDDRVRVAGAEVLVHRDEARHRHDVADLRDRVRRDREVVVLLVLRAGAVAQVEPVLPEDARRDLHD